MLWFGPDVGSLPRRVGAVADVLPAGYNRGMPPPYARHVLVCTNRRPPEAPRGSCAGRGSEEVLAAFKREVSARGLGDAVRANASGCLDACEHGPSVVVYPDGVWYARVTPEDVPAIVAEHLEGGRPVERLRAPIPAAPPRKLPPLLR